MIPSESTEAKNCLAVYDEITLTLFFVTPLLLMNKHKKTTILKLCY